jgi:hypothetical protein
LPSNECSLTGPGGRSVTAAANTLGFKYGEIVKRYLARGARLPGQGDCQASAGISMNSIEWLQSWYMRQCDGEWEHEHGVSIQTLDNPGWMLRIDLTGTSLEGVSMKAIAGTINHLGMDGNHQWIDCRVESNQFVGAGGPMSLIQICDIFMRWAEGEKP